MLAAAAFVAVAAVACERTGEGEYQVTTPDVDVRRDVDTVRTPTVEMVEDTITVRRPEVRTPERNP